MRHRLQELVAGVVAERVVDVLEAIEVEEQHGRLQTAALRQRDGLGEVLLQEHAVGQPGERVVVGEPPDLFLRRARCRDVVERHDGGDGLAVTSLDERHRRGEDP